MTPTQKKKAKELVYKYYTLSFNVLHTDCEGDSAIASGTCTMENAKQCAIITVNEILCSGALSPQLKRHVLTGLQPDITELEYWYQVKEEIKKL